VRQGLGGSGDLCYLERRGEGRILFFERKQKKKTLKKDVLNMVSISHVAIIDVKFT
jgi:hypothetical protein